MPWVVKKTENGKWAVHKEGADGQPVGEALGTHDSEDDAKRQQRALYASEAKSVKFAGDGADETLIEMCLTPTGGIFNGRDLDQQFFSGKTDFCLSWRPDAAYPVLYHHGLDPDAGPSVVGRGKSFDLREDGGWLQAQLDASSKYFTALKELIKQGKLYASSGAMAHLVKVDTKSGEILRWPLVEASLTPTPSNLLATVDFATAEKHYKAADLDPAPLKAMSERQMHSMATGMADGIKAVSYEDIRSEIGTLLDKRAAMMMPVSMGMELRPSFYVDRTFSDHAIASMYHDGKQHFLSIPYTLDEDGHVASIGEATEVEQTYIPAESKAVDGLSIVEHAEVTAKYAATLAQRTKDLRERRIKEGRVISGINRKRIRECMDAMDGAMTALRDLYDSTEPQPAKAASVRRVRAQIAALRIQALALS